MLVLPEKSNLGSEVDLLKGFKSSSRFLFNIPESMQPLVIAELATQAFQEQYSLTLVVAKNQSEAEHIKEHLYFFVPNITVRIIPEWDCLPYDRISPSRDVLAARIDAFICLREHQKESKTQQIYITTANNLLQRQLPFNVVDTQSFTVNKKQEIDPTIFLQKLHKLGFTKTETVTYPGEYCRRGNLVDFYPAGHQFPIRLDFDDIFIETIKSFDPISQRTINTMSEVKVRPASEVFFSEEVVESFRSRYREIFQTTGIRDPLYESISEHRPYGGMEHWLPLFYPNLVTLFDYLPINTHIILDASIQSILISRIKAIDDYYQARSNQSDRLGSGFYHALPASYLYLNLDELKDKLKSFKLNIMSNFSDTTSLGSKSHLKGSIILPHWIGQNQQINYQLLREFIYQQQKSRRVIITACTSGSLHRLELMLKEQGFASVVSINKWSEVFKLSLGTIALTVLPLERGYLTDEYCVLSEQDILGGRVIRPTTAKHKKTQDLLLTLSRFVMGDFLVHQEYGIGRYDGLEIIQVGNAPHDCVKLTYDGNDKLFIPVENIDILSRHSSGDVAVTLDRLGGVSWQNRKARIQNHIQEIAEDLIKTAAAREIQEGYEIVPEIGSYDEFCRRFPYPETEDQIKAINDVIGDLAKGYPMDRLICGDVGFGKTEIALRAAFVAVSKGLQVALLTPTTLLCRQHYETFKRRFAGFPYNIVMLSRFNKPSAATAIKEQVKGGGADILIGTHALLSEQVQFKNLGLLIIDEEQHFGVIQKEKIKKIQENVHILTLTATPIPRTLQMAMADIKQMSLITTPPIDRLPVKTFVLAYDPVTIRDAILQEFYRGGQIFYVCPRIEDLTELSNELANLVPEVKHIVIHGQMRTTELEKAMIAFYDRSYQMLLSTNIIESGLDIPSANTIVIHRADMFGLSQLYQLRGRVGRSKVRGYAYLTVQPNYFLKPTAQKRLEVMQNLENLGGGFTIASYDLDIRGSGNLLGAEQSGHVREVGVELYQQMLADAIEKSKKGDHKTSSEQQQPQINLGVPVLIPDNYVSDLGIRLDLYRRIASLSDSTEINSFAAELEDRFGKIPTQTENLLAVIILKSLCKKIGVRKIDVGQKGVVIHFYVQLIQKTETLVGFVNRYSSQISLKPDGRLIFLTTFQNDQDRLQKTTKLLKQLAAELL